MFAKALPTPVLPGSGKTGVDAGTRILSACLTQTPPAKIQLCAVSIWQRLRIINMDFYSFYAS